MLSQADFINRYERERSLYESWGRFVTAQVKQRLVEVGVPGGVEYFLKIPPIHRTKTVDSLVAKAYLRGKRYADPYAEITDKVGTRFVVLLLSDLQVVKDVIEKSACWTHSKDRDFEEEREANPTLFEYQSVHYVVRSAAGVSDGDAMFPEGIPCEVQIRTLLQHAFSELTHDSVYKSTKMVPPDVQRTVARSIALIDTTDHLFEEVTKMLSNMDAATRQMVTDLGQLYRDITGQAPSPDLPANALLLSELQDLWSGDLADLRIFLKEVPPLRQWVRDRADTQVLFRQPAVLLVYYLADRKRHDLRREWPLLETELAPIMTDLGYGG